MSKKLEMTFSRDKDDKEACLEYSWVPEGNRHLILLMPGERRKTETDLVGDDVDASHVQVYVMNINDRWSSDNWQFPPGPPRPAKLASALVNVIEDHSPATASGTVDYVNAPSVTDPHQLDKRHRQCPQI